METIRCTAAILSVVHPCSADDYRRGCVIGSVVDRFRHNLPCLLRLVARRSYGVRRDCLFAMRQTSQTRRARINMAEPYNTPLGTGMPSLQLRFGPLAEIELRGRLVCASFRGGFTLLLIGTLVENCEARSVVPIDIPNRANCAHASPLRCQPSSAIDYRDIARMIRARTGTVICTYRAWIIGANQ